MTLEDLKEEVNALYVKDDGDYNYEGEGRPAFIEEKATYVYHHLCESKDVIALLKSCTGSNQIIEFFDSKEHIDELIKILKNEVAKW